MLCSGGHHHIIWVKAQSLKHMAGELPITYLADLGDWLHEPWQIRLPGVERLIKASVGIGAMSIYHPRSRQILGLFGG